jgi:hypothetical protein
MPETMENVALRLRQFTAAADHEVSGRGFQSQVLSGPRHSPPKSQQQTVYEECVAELTDDERDALARMIEKMRRRLGIRPPGAIPQP